MSERPGRTRTIVVVGLMLVLIGGGSLILQREIAETITAALVLSIVWAGLIGALVPRSTPAAAGCSVRSSPRCWPARCWPGAATGGSPSATTR